MTNLKTVLTIYGLLNEISVILTILIGNVDDTEEFELIEAMEKVNSQLFDWIDFLIEIEPNLEELDLVLLISTINNDFELIEYDLNDQILNLNYSDSFYGFMKLKGYLLNIQRLFKAKNFDCETETMKSLIDKSLHFINILKKELS